MADESNAIHTAFLKEVGTETDFCVIYLDDEDGVFDLVRLNLSQFGLKTIATTSPAKALELIKQNRKKLVFIISDFNMPEMDGFAFREQVMKVAPEIPFTILSGYIDRDSALRGLELKIAGFLDKPVEPVKLAELLLKDGLPRLKSLKEDEELLQGFIGEAQNLVEESESLLLVLEQEPNDLDSLNKFFGIIHTIKGASSFFEPKTLHVFAHRFEETLKKIQRGEITPTPDVISSLLKGIDIIKEMVGDFQSPDPKNYDVEQLVAEIFVVGTPQVAKADDEKVPPARPTAVHTPKQTEIKVPISILDEFMQTSGEMTVIRNMLNKCVRSIEKQYAGDKEIATLVELLEELHKINGDVQVKVTELRKVGLNNILKPLPRAVRDIAGALKKEIQFESGDNLRVDTAIADVLSSCFLHLVKNSIDHGLEMPAERTALGKPASGKVSISTVIKNEQVQVEVEDDGKGIDSNAIRAKLRKNGKHSNEQIDAMSDDEVYLMIFEAGFSTAQQVTDISGRGVGMSMVKDTVVAAGGTIKIQSHPGKGTKFLLNLPIPKSVLITDCLFVKSGNDQFGILEEDILRALRIPSDQIEEQIHHLEGTRAVLLEDEFVPIVELSSLLGVITENGTDKNDLNLVILSLPDQGRKLALRVEEILEIEDTVIKNLQFHVNPHGLYRGATFLGDGRLGLILNTVGLFENAFHSQNVRTDVRKKSAPETSQKNTAPQGILLCELEQSGVYGISQDSIFRVEEIDVSRATPSGELLLLPYRNQVLNLLDVSKVLFSTQLNTLTDGEKRSVVIIENKGHLIGLLFKSVWDVVQLDQMNTDLVSENSGILGHYIHNERTVTLLDVDSIVSRSSQRLMQKAAA